MEFILKFVFCAGLLAGSGVSYATRVLHASCEMGQGCTFQLSEATAEEIDLAMGTADLYSTLPENAIVVSVKTSNGWQQYIETKRTRSELDKRWGGDGYTMIYAFNPNIQPLDGQWTSRVGNVSASSCVIDLLSMIQKIQGKSWGGNINFHQPFTARQFLNHADVVWVQVKPDYYRGVLNFGKSGGPMELIYDVRIINEKNISGTIKLIVRIPGKETCTGSIPVHYTLIKEKDRKEKVSKIAEEADLLDVVPKGNNGDDLMEVKPKGELMEEKIKDKKTPVKRIQPDVPLLDKDKPKTNIPFLKD